MKYNELILLSWTLLNVFLIAISFNITVFSKSNYKALIHIISPAVALAVIFIFPDHILQSNYRTISLGAGFLFSFITNKMIVFSMAKMTFAAFQPDILPLLSVSLLARFSPSVTDYGIEKALQSMAMWQFVRTIWWSNAAIGQLCVKLDINCFSIKKQAGKSE